MIYIFVQGGVVSAVASDLEQNYVLVDYDTDGLTADEYDSLPEVLQPNGTFEKANVYSSSVDSLSEDVRKQIASVA